MAEVDDRDGVHAEFLGGDGAMPAVLLAIGVDGERVEFAPALHHVLEVVDIVAGGVVHFQRSDLREELVGRHSADASAALLEILIGPPLALLLHRERIGPNAVIGISQNITGNPLACGIDTSLLVEADRVGEEGFKVGVHLALGDGAFEVVGAAVDVFHDDGHPAQESTEPSGNLLLANVPCHVGQGDIRK